MIVRLCFLRLSAHGTFAGHGHYFYLWRDIPSAPARPNPLDHIFFEEAACFPSR